ncbi:major facilitator superfamily domain-containing protein [Phthorimaea operculella]|nr:major facilitator superfamily domain-containing protein [Phthorimaea operculella]
MSLKGTTDAKIGKPTYGLGFRHVNALMLSLGMMICYAMRVFISIAIVSMTDPSNDNSFDWNVQIQSVILSSFFWGYVVLQIPSGEMAARFGGKILVTICVGINSATALILPIGSYYGGWQLVCACRVLQGLSQGFLFPSMHNLIGKWVPIEEKSSLGTFIYAGSQIGTALQLIVAGYISEYWGWPAIFYSTGTLGAVWTVVYMFIGSDSPYTSRLISDEERFYIQSSLGHLGEPKKIKTPWKSIWTSVPFLALVIAHCGQNWGFWTLMTEMPSYMDKVLGVDIKANGVMSAIPYMAMFLVSFPLGYLSDLALRKNWLSLTVSRKFSNSVGHYGPAIALLGLSYVPGGDVAAVVALLTVALALNAGHFTGYLLVHIDMSPNFAGQMMGITNFFANIMGIVAPLVAGVLLKDETDANDWRKVFFLSSAVYVFCNTIFVIFGTSKRQTWNEVSDRNENSDKEAQKKEERAVV